MKSRVITGLVGGALLIAVLLLPPIALLLGLVVVCVSAMYELLSTKGLANNRGLLIVSLLFAACVPFFMSFESRLPAYLVLFVYITALVCVQIRQYNTLSMEHTSFVLAMSLVFPVAFSCLGYLRLYSERDGLFYVFLTLIIAWTCDIGAYFVGTFFGKHKLCPHISPKKTVEGLVGGLAVSVVCSVAAGALYQALFLKDGVVANLWQIAALALVGGGLSVLGDLFASLIKRQSHVKDFGNVMPGHGGFMDRFDSLALVAPLVYLVVQYLPLIY